MYIHNGIKFNKQGSEKHDAVQIKRAPGHPVPIMYNSGHYAFVGHCLHSRRPSSHLWGRFALERDRLAQSPDQLTNKLLTSYHWAVRWLWQTSADISPSGLLASWRIADISPSDLLTSWRIADISPSGLLTSWRIADILSISALSWRKRLTTSHRHHSCWQIR